MREVNKRRYLRMRVLGVVFCCMAGRTYGQETHQVDDHLLFHSTFDDTTDVNLFGPDNDAGWIYTADSTRRFRVLMNNRCPSVTIAKSEGKIRDCLNFASTTKNVLFYQASPNLESPRRDWSGTVSFWLKPRLSRSKSDTCYPIQLCDGNWDHGGFFVRFCGKPSSAFELGTVSGRNVGQLMPFPEDVAEEQCSTLTVDTALVPNDQWTMVSFTFENINSSRREGSIVKLYLNEKLAGEIRKPLRINWMEPDSLEGEPNAAVFLGINYVGCVDDLRIYHRSLTGARIKMLYQAAQ